MTRMTTHTGASARGCSRPRSPCVHGRGARRPPGECRRGRASTLPIERPSRPFITSSPFQLSISFYLRPLDHVSDGHFVTARIRLWICPWIFGIIDSGFDIKEGGMCTIREELGEIDSEDLYCIPNPSLYKYVRRYCCTPRVPEPTGRCSPRTKNVRIQSREPGYQCRYLHRERGRPRPLFWHGSVIPNLLSFTRGRRVCSKSRRLVGSQSMVGPDLMDDDRSWSPFTVREEACCGMARTACEHNTLKRTTVLVLMVCLAFPPGTLENGVTEACA
ncbi:hypothetical protein LY76DRAFT_135986 [Colletotrichum caudatum]|nr:hypothetical protein LY76DRAFT_135986 [Colletotrichum caudatum]